MNLHLGDCLDVLRTLPDNSVDAVVTDPPYFKVKKEHWDRQWDKPHQFIAWLDTIAEQWQRVLKPNGSLYCFASPRMAARVEVMLADRFNVLNHLVWDKAQTTLSASRHQCKEVQRVYFPATERIIFCEHYGADNIAKGEAGYGAKCDEPLGFVFEPLRAWFIEAWVKSGLTRRMVDKACGSSNVTQYWFLERNYQIPTLERYRVLQELSPSFFSREYEDLRREYEDLRRPFSVSKEVPYTDVWTFEPVRPYKGKHPCEKPQDLLRHIIATSTRPGAVVLDSFMGTGSTGEACAALHRKFIGIERDPEYFEIAKARIAAVQEADW